jgi:hypothetical protein
MEFLGAIRDLQQVRNQPASWFEIKETDRLLFKSSTNLCRVEMVSTFQAFSLFQAQNTLLNTSFRISTCLLL